MMHLLALATIGLLLAGAGALIRPRVRPILIGHLAIIFYAMQINGSPAVDILTSRNDNERTGANLQETILRADNVNPTRFGRLFSYPTKSDVYAQPLVASDIDIPGRGRRNVVFVANVSNDLFAFDADGPLKNEDGVLWQRNLGTPETIDDALGSAGDGNVRKHGDIGILGTPVIDRERGLIFLVSRKKRTPDRDSQGGRGADSTISQWLHAIDMATGGESRGSPVEIKATRLAIPNDANSRIDFNPRIQNQRAGLALTKDQIIVAWGSHEDQKQYHGWVMSYRYDGAGFIQTGVLLTTPTGDPDALKISGVCLVTGLCQQGGVWQTGRAPAIDDQGNVLLFVGNGHNELTALGANRSFGNSFVRLDPVSLAVLDFFTPKNYCDLEKFDLDLGGSGPMIIPGSHLVVGGGKEGRMYIWNLDVPLGGFTANNAGAMQEFFAGEPGSYHWVPSKTYNNLLQFVNANPQIRQGIDLAIMAARAIGGAASRCVPVIDLIDALGDKPVFRAGHIMGGPAYWDRRESARLYNWSEDSELRAYKVDPTSPSPVTTDPIGRGPILLHGHPGGILALSANGAESASGIVWAATYDPQRDLEEGALHLIKPGILRAYAADDVTKQLWTSESDEDPFGSFAKFNPPTVANGRVYIATFGGSLRVYGLLEYPYLRPGEVPPARKAGWWLETLAPVHGN